ncbi:GDP-L-fucose synthase [Prosthecobacter debontii]|uniref:GDP-L-fucose synthase n=1 Tax=Prosthecobacter debontii TaxID=48467 RepID=A0A1T4YUA2_9BACT|nr:GDP-L-fucose synthase [Prosthecobacter debontii]SKB05342.1 GDP-L-fucose synthase [Prosthecobacter debontii]
MPRIYIAGHRGMVGSAIARALRQRGETDIVTATHAELDLRRQTDVEHWLDQNRPNTVILAAAKVGGIHANSTYPAEFIYDNLIMAANVIHAAYNSGVKRLLFLGSSCIYPRLAPQPMPEDCLLTGPLECTNEAYALAKIAGLKLCQHYRQQYGVTFHSAMPTNLYGPGDNYHPENSHVIPGLIRRFHQAKVDQVPSVTVWGTGKPLREFLNVEDLAAACLHLLDLENPPDWVNVGSGQECSIGELAETVKRVVGYEGELCFDSTKPDGTPRKLLDSHLIQSLGWLPQVSLEEGLRAAYADFVAGSV